MPTIAVLGATGQTGIEVVKFLLTDPSYQDYQINIWARSVSKLHATFPFLVDDSDSKARERVAVFTGSLDDRDTMVQCIQHSNVIIAGIAQNRNEPGCDIAQRSAHSIVQALDIVRKIRPCPRLVWISSASISPHSPSRENMAIGQKVALYAFQYIYDDIRRALAYLNSIDWLPLIIAEPGALVHHEATEVELVEARGSELVPYADFGKAMVMMGTDDKWVGKNVGIKVNGGEELSPKYMLPLLRYLFPGLLGSFSPWLYDLGRGWWPS